MTLSEIKHENSHVEKWDLATRCRIAVIFWQCSAGRCFFRVPISSVICHWTAIFRFPQLRWNRCDGLTKSVHCFHKNNQQNCKQNFFLKKNQFSHLTLPRGLFPLRSHFHSFSTELELRAKSSLPLFLYTRPIIYEEINTMLIRTQITKGTWRFRYTTLIYRINAH